MHLFTYTDRQRHGGCQHEETDTDILKKKCTATTAPVSPAAMENLEIKTNLFIPSRSGAQATLRATETAEAAHTTLDGGIFRTPRWTSSLLERRCQQIKALLSLSSAMNSGEGCVASRWVIETDTAMGLRTLESYTSTETSAAIRSPLWCLSQKKTTYFFKFFRHPIFFELQCIFKEFKILYILCG